MPSKSGCRMVLILGKQLLDQLDLARELGVERREARAGVAAQANQPVVGAHGPEQQHGRGDPGDDGVGHAGDE